MPRAFCELNEDGTRIRVFFPYDAQAKDRIKSEIAGYRYHGPNDKEYDPEEGVFWSVPAELRAARKLRDIFGHGLTLGDAVREWGREAAQKERNLGSLSVADDAKLKRVPEVAPIIMRIIDGEPIPELGLPKKHPLSRKRPARPYQRADIAMMALANVINANQPGTGKTLEALGALVEAELEDGPHLVCAPRTSLVNTWKVEINRIFPSHQVFTSEDPKERRRQVELGLEAAAKGQPCWVLVIFDDLRVKKVADPSRTRNPDKPEFVEAMAKDPLYARKDHKGCVYHFNSELHKRIVARFWNSFNVDEFHRAGLNNPMSLFTLGTDLIKAKKHWRMSGTPMGGKPIHLFPVLRSIDKKGFSSKWRWAGEWLEIEDNGYGKKIGGIKPGKEEEFYEFHKTVMVRRMKREALPGLPPKVPEIVMCEMTPRQAKQYAKFDADAEVRIAGEEGSRLVVGDCILAEFSRLKQFANAYCELNARGEVCPTEDSGKLPYLLEKLDECGLRKVDPEPGARAIVASQSKRMVEMVHKWLLKHGIPNDMLTGDTKDSAPIIKRFQDLDDEQPYVIVMTTQTGGVSLNLEPANSVHILDESWNPDEEEQLEDRGDRGTRETSLLCVYYRTRGTVQEYIAEVAEDKKITNATALDIYRQIQKARGGVKVAA